MSEGDGPSDDALRRAYAFLEQKAAERREQKEEDNEKKDVA
jgi:hypothetical protein